YLAELEPIQTEPRSAAKARLPPAAHASSTQRANLYHLDHPPARPPETEFPALRTARRPHHRVPTAERFLSTVGGPVGNGSLLHSAAVPSRVAARPRATAADWRHWNKRSQGSVPRASSTRKAASRTAVAMYRLPWLHS